MSREVETEKQEMDSSDAYDFILSMDVGYIVLDGIFLELSSAVEITESN